jgi:NAD kinase
MVRQGKYSVHSFPQLELHVNGNPTSYTALNDVYVERLGGPTGKLRIHVDGVLVVWEVVLALPTALS